MNLPAQTAAALFVSDIQNLLSNIQNWKALKFTADSHTFSTYHDETVILGIEGGEIRINLQRYKVFNEKGKWV